MPIGGFVVSVLPEDMERVKEALKGMIGCDVYEALHGGPRGDSNIVITLETATSSEMEQMVEEIKRVDGVLTVDLAYLNIEDEADA